MLTHELGGFLHGHIGVHGNELGCHDVANGTVHLAVFRNSTDHDVAVGDDTDRLSVVDDWHHAGIFVAHDAGGALDAVIGRNGSGIGSHHVADIHGLPPASRWRHAGNGLNACTGVGAHGPEQTTSKRWTGSAGSRPSRIIKSTWGGARRGGSSALRSRPPSLCSRSSRIAS